MARSKPRYVISLQTTQGISPPLTFTVTGSKGEKILDLLRPDIEKHKDRTKPTSATLEPFFKEEN
tara:strand:- start:1132 stop:1326 length:195 start_codon:yes stop_codon:yes gene_type:complete